MDIVFKDNSGQIDRERMQEIMLEIGLDQGPDEQQGLGSDEKMEEFVSSKSEVERR